MVCSYSKDVFSTDLNVFVNSVTDTQRFATANGCWIMGCAHLSRGMLRLELGRHHASSSVGFYLIDVTHGLLMGLKH